MVAIRRHRLSKSRKTVRHKNLAILCSEAQFILHLLNKSLAATIDSDQRKFQEKVSLLATMGNVPDQGRARNAGWRMASLLCLGACFRYQKRLLRAYIKPILE
jgi:hypothetical protein